MCGSGSDCAFVCGYGHGACCAGHVIYFSVLCVLLICVQVHCPLQGRCAKGDSCPDIHDKGKVQWRGFCDKDHCPSSLSALHCATALPSNPFSALSCSVDPSPLLTGRLPAPVCCGIQCTAAYYTDLQSACSHYHYTAPLYTALHTIAENIISHNLTLSDCCVPCVPSGIVHRPFMSAPALPCSGADARLWVLCPWRMF
jgi:hypothetical protein